MTGEELHPADAPALVPVPVLAPKPKHRARAWIVSLSCIAAGLIGFAAGVVAWQVASSTVYTSMYAKENASSRHLVDVIAKHDADLSIATNTLAGANDFLNRPKPDFVSQPGFDLLKQSAGVLAATTARTHPAQGVAGELFAPTPKIFDFPWATIATAERMRAHTLRTVASIHQLAKEPLR